MVAALGASARGRSRQRHLDLQLLEGIAEALPRLGLVDGLAQALAHTAAAAFDGPAYIAESAFARIDW
jgi:hypothetical protein